MTDSMPTTDPAASPSAGDEPTLAELVERWMDEKKSWRSRPFRSDAEAERLAAGTFDATELAMAGVPVRSGADALAALAYLEEIEVLDPDSVAAHHPVHGVVSSVLKELRAYLGRQ